MAPAGSYEALQAAIQAGADAVYFGVGQLNMRSKSAANFTPDDLERIVGIAHAARVKTYLTVNTVIYEDELRQMHALVDSARAAGVDAVIASDLSVILYARRIGVEVHISTQCNLTNSEAVKFFSQWADVVVLARELSLDQIGRIARAIDQQHICGPSGEPVRIEMFAHGALCMAVSGKCYLSLHETGCSANRGACRQICRRKYTLTDVETGAQLSTDGQYLLSPKDLCTIDFLDRFLAAGVRVLKIEGRARGAEYVKRVVGCYDRALRAMEAGEYTPELAAALKEACDHIDENAGSDALFLTSDSHLTPVFALAGRRILCGSGSYVYYHGMDYSAEYNAMRALYETPDEDTLAAWDIGYAVFDSSVYAKFAADESWYAARYDVWYENAACRVYKIK